MMRRKGKGYDLPHSGAKRAHRYASDFESMEMETKNGQTILSGEVKDQPHLFGILDRLNSLGLELLII